jgi:cobyrinic acid a,c-diamide synthase
VKALVVAGTHSGCGKTSVALGLLAALTRRGLAAQPFKAGPDFIDPGLHRIAAGRSSHNLDGWMCPHRAVRALFARHCQGADVAVVEGVMGLYDGLSGDSDQGSTAEIARLLGLPVLLVADARSMARSAAALAQGFARFQGAPPLAGVAFNRVGGAGHRDILTQAMADCPDVALLGLLGRDDSLAMPSRHLGLVTAQDQALSLEFLQRLADWIEQGIDLDRLLGNLPHASLEPVADAAAAPTRCRVGLASDSAFCFVYQENLRLLESFGAELVPFSPLADQALPPGLSGLYLPGGYPELRAGDLAANERLRSQVRGLALAGLPVYAECGGFMYLMRSLRTGGDTFPMAGVFDMDCAMEERFQALGYRQATFAAPCPLGPAGTVVRGHEFHYSRAMGLDPEARPMYGLDGRAGPLDQPEGFLKGNTLGSYVHLHFGSNPDAARSFADLCAASSVST